MNISKAEQRTLQALAQGGRIIALRADGPRIAAIEC